MEPGDTGNTVFIKMGYYQTIQARSTEGSKEVFMAGSIIFLKTVVAMYGFKEAMDLEFMLPKKILSSTLFMQKMKKIVFRRRTHLQKIRQAGFGYSVQTDG